MIREDYPCFCVVLRRSSPAKRRKAPPVSSDASRQWKVDIMVRLPPAAKLVLHLTGWRDAWWRAGNGSRAWVDNGDGVARALGHWLVQLHLVLHVVLLKRGVVKRIWRCREDKGRGRLRLVLEWRAFGRARGEGRAIGRG